MASQANNASASPSPIPSSKAIHVSNYRQKDSSDDVRTALLEFFSFCGGIKNLTLHKEPKDGYFSATIEFHDAASAQVAALMDRAVVGHPDEQISVKLIDIPEVQPGCPTDKIPQTDQSMPDEAVYMTPAGIIQKVIDLGFKLKDGTLELAQQINTSIKTQPVSQTLKQMGDAVLTSGQVALDVTQHALHSTSDATAGVLKTVGEATHHGMSTAGEVTAGLIKSTGEALPPEVKAVGSAVGTAVINTSQATVEGLKMVGRTVSTTGQVLYDVSGNVLHNAGQATVDTFKTVGNTVSTTGQVLYDVSGNALHNASTATSELLKSAGSTVVTTSTVALDVTGHKLQQVSNATVEATQIAAATVASVYEPLLGAASTAQATVTSAFSNMIGNLNNCSTTQN